jgi:hypothetical protein
VFVIEHFIGTNETESSFSSSSHDNGDDDNDETKTKREREEKAIAVRCCFLQPTTPTVLILFCKGWRNADRMTGRVRK